MPILPPLAVRLITSGTSYPITNRMLDDLTMRNTAPGGFASLSCKLSAPLNVDHAELNPYAQVEVVDTRTGEVVWFGRLEDPGRSSAGGQVWALNAVGPGSHADDVKRPVVYHDGRMDKWTRYEKSVTPSATVDASGDPTAVDDPATNFAFPRGTVLATNGRVVQRYDLLRATGQHVGRLDVRLTGGRITASAQQDWVGRQGPAAEGVLASRTMTTTTGTLSVVPVPGALHRVPELRLIWTAVGATVADDVTWNEAKGTRVQPTRLDRLGATVTDATQYASVSTVLPHRVVEDVLGRYLPEFDRAGAQVDTTATLAISQMAYEDGASARQILDDLMALVPTHWWAAWGNESGAGARFEWKPWPTMVGLDGLDTARDEFTSSGSAADLFNEVQVRYKDALGRSASLVRTATNPTLTAAGLVRRAQLDLGGTLGDITQAAAAGDLFLSSHLNPSNGGQIRVARPITDWSTGRRLWPWQLRAGVLARVGNLQPRQDELNPVPNGSTLFRVSEVAYSASQGSAVLTLDGYDRTVSRALAALAKGQARQRRE